MPNAHAHNDYVHERPLLDALDQGFVSVEADVWLIDGELYVYHDLPERPAESRRLEELYLKPLLKRVTRNQGDVYPGYAAPFYLMIDFKSEAVSTYEALLPLLMKYSDMLATVSNGNEDSGKPVKVFISGSRPVNQVMKAEVAFAAIDGRPEDLGKGFDPALMPVVSQSMLKYSRWRGAGDMPEADKYKIKALADRAHAEGKKLRLWANPDTENGWKILMELGVDLINTDKLEAFSRFMREEN
jgi:glycerophosphoryl diester phosphodiesterase